MSPDAHPDTPHSPHISHAKILSRESLIARRRDAQRRGLRVVQCHGCFDIVHPGHVRHLRHAKSLGDVLLVTITADRVMSKGTGRPLIPEELRAENLAALDIVDWVHIEGRPTAVELLAEVRPDVYVKGKEYENNGDPRFRAEREAVEAHGGRVVFSSGDVVFSSTALITAIEAAADPLHARHRELLARSELDGERLFAHLSAIRGQRVVVVGEVILDTYILCDRPDVAGESPILTLRPLDRRRYDGGAAVVARHAAALGAKVTLITALADRGEGLAMRLRLESEGINVRTIAIDAPVAEKQRFLVGAQKVMKLDLLGPMVLDASQQDHLVKIAADTAAETGGCDAAIITDFGLGLFTRATMTRLCRALRSHARILSGDVSGRRSNLAAMRGADLLCPSESELREAMRQFDEGLPAVTWRLLSACKAAAAIITMGPEGLVAFDRLPGADAADAGWQSRLHSEHIPAMCPWAIDALGCGDALLTAATLMLSVDAPLVAAGYVGAAAAAIQAQRIGNTSITAADIRRMIARIQSSQLAWNPTDPLAQITPSSQRLERIAG